MGFFFLASLRGSAATPPLASALEPIREQYHLPALAGAIFTTDGVTEMAAVGVRKAGTTVPVTANDEWHLGSDTKAMTATLAGTFVAERKLSWDARIVSFFPELKDRVPAAMRYITLGDVLCHRAGLAENLDWARLSRLRTTVAQQRVIAVREALTSPAYAPGTFHYANTGYVVAGAVLERISGQPWEQLMRQRLFRPLKMAGAGFGGTGTRGRIDQPWPHLADGKPTPENGFMTDNPPVMAPAGEVHCPMTAWARFLADQLRGAAGDSSALLPAAIYRAIQTPRPGADYAFGWSVARRPWAGGTVLTHAGSNTMNYAVCWLAPKKGFGVLVCCNQGGDIAAKACDEASAALIQHYQSGHVP